jgi:hypothetical protein
VVASKSPQKSGAMRLERGRLRPGGTEGETGGIARSTGKKQRMFFFEKKNQKTFTCFGAR